MRERTTKKPEEDSMANEGEKRIGEEFMRLTRYAYLGPSDQSRRMPLPPVVRSFTADAAMVDLPAPGDLNLQPLDFHALVTERTSLRRYTATPLSLEELSFLLWCTQGVKEVSQIHTLRTVPSAGSRHPFETVLLVNRVNDLESGLYAYDALGHKLALLRTGDDLGDHLAAVCHGQAFMKHSAVSFIWVAVPYRTTWRYTERGYRYLHLDAGHVCQNLYLAAEAIGGGACAVAAFDDDALIDFLHLDPAEAFVIYLAAVGKRPQETG